MVAWVTPISIGRADRDRKADFNLDFHRSGLSKESGGVGGDFADLASVALVAGSELAASSAPWIADAVVPLVSAAVGGEVLTSEVVDGIAQVAIAIDTSLRTITQDQVASASLLAFCSEEPTHVVAPLQFGVEEVVAVLDITGEGIGATPVAAFDETRSYCRITIEGRGRTRVPQIVRLPRAMQRWRGRVGLLATLDAVGVARTALEYAGQREQFGRPIESSQAYKHRCATAYIDLFLAQALILRAANDLSRDAESTELALPAAVFSIAKATRICRDAVQLHGGIGFTWEAGLHRYLKRPRASRVMATGRSDVARRLRREWFS